MRIERCHWPSVLGGRGKEGGGRLAVVFFFSLALSAGLFGLRKGKGRGKGRGRGLLLSQKNKKKQIVVGVLGLVFLLHACLPACVAFPSGNKKRERERRKGTKGGKEERRVQDKIRQDRKKNRKST